MTPSRNTLVALLAFVMTGAVHAGDTKHSPSGDSLVASAQPRSFPSHMTMTVKSVYRHRRDGKAGREIELAFAGGKVFGGEKLEVSVNGAFAEMVRLPESAPGLDHFTLLLPPDVGVTQEVHVHLALRRGKKELRQQIAIPAQRQWTVYIYPHSHVDIGYSNTQANVEIIHRRNLFNGIRIASETANNPEGSRYLWNPEVLWAVERTLKSATPEESKRLIDGMRKGYIRLDASYANVNTSVCADEELFHLFDESRTLQKLTGTSVNTFVQTDIPGISWGLIPVMQREGIKYVYHLFNGGGRVGLTPEMTTRPFWWVGPDGKSKVLFFQPNTGYLQFTFKKGYATGRPWLGQLDPNKIPETIKTENPRVNFLDDKLLSVLGELEKSPSYPYDIYSLSWSLWDNTPLDEDLPAAVKSWNSEYAYPHLIIASAGEILSAFDRKFGDQLPVLRGDLTEYWTDGVGTGAALTSMNRSTKERLIQTETLWSMINTSRPAPRNDFDEAWRNVILGTEHTWVFERMGIGTGIGFVDWSADQSPQDAFFRDDIFRVKKSYFREAEDRSKALLRETLAPIIDSTSSSITVFNTLSWSRGGLVAIPGGEPNQGARVTDEDGIAVPSQVLSTGELVFLASDVRAFGSKTYAVRNGRQADPEVPCTIDGIRASNGLLTVTLDAATGNIVSLMQNGLGHDYVNPSVDGGLNAFRQLPGGSNMAHPDTLVTIKVKEKGPLVAEWQVESCARGCNAVIRRVRLVAGQPWVECADTVDKKKVTDKEGIHFGFAFNIANPTTRVDIPWAVMRVEEDQMPAANRNWLALQRWLDVSNEHHGVTWVSLDAPLFEVGGMTANIMVDGPGWLHHLDPSATIYSWALNNHWYTNFPLSQEGRIGFRYRVMPHAVGFSAAAANRFGMEQSQPLIGVPGTVRSNGRSIIALEGAPAVSVSILKTSDDGKSLIVRLRSVSDNPERVTLSWPARTPRLVRLCERGEEPGEEIHNDVVIPGNDFITLRADW